jgi:signal transduction histidine kinase
MAVRGGGQRAKGRRCFGPASCAAPLLLGDATPALAEELSVPVGEFAARTLALLPSLTVQDAASFSLLAGSVLVTTATALLYTRERRRTLARERRLQAEIARLRETADRLALFASSEGQLVIVWKGRDAPPEVEGDLSILGEAASLRHLPAFASWLAPADASSLENGLDRLRDCGQSFALAAKTLSGRLVEAHGRAVGGHAVLRLRDITGDNAELLRIARELSGARADIAAITGLLDTVPHPMWLRDPEDRLVWANQAYLRAVEARSLDEVRMRALELLDTSTRREAHRKRLEGAAFSQRVPAVVAGERHILEVVEKPTATGSAGIAVDVSEAEAMRSDLQRQMQAHVRTLDQLPTAVAIFDVQQRLVFHNAAYQTLWSLDGAFLDSAPTDGEVLDRLRSLRKLPEQADFRAWKAGVLAGYRAVESSETWWHLPDRRTLRVVMNPNPQGGVTYLYDDVSERFMLASQVTALTRVQSETLETLKEGVAVFGMDGRLKFFNRAFLELWSLSQDQVADQPHIEAVLRACAGLALDDEPWLDIRAAVAGSDMRTGLNARMERRDGTVLDCTAQPLPDGATLLTFIDMTDSVEVERALTERNEALERASRLRDEFVHHVSYQLRSPLQNVVGYSQFLEQESIGSLNPRQREYAAHITSSAEALLAIIDDILDLASIDTGSLELNPARVDIRATIEAARKGVEDRLAEKELALRIDAPEDIGSFVADGKRIRQILFNLLSNAISFSSRGQTIRVTARKADGQVTLQVVDQGRGIPAEVKAKVFNRFESHTLGTEQRGAGLGLSIVRSFVELHGGRIDLASAPGLGTTVTCTFPAEGVPLRLAAE